ncbi:hypothetical protein HGRIS_004201 [Hohenbuehelia grisea]|uniref:O-methyltransferase n=1 Tax=Hohenbuehelia grisea TaxID=104357 RepID=A0ABR3JJI8_9AGAR
MSALKALAQTILTNIDALEAAHAAQGSSVPLLDDLFKPSVVDSDPAATSAAREIAKAATELAAIVRSPLETLQECCMGMYTAPIIGFINEHNIADILLEAGPKGLHSDEIGKRIEADGSKVDRILRYLATRYIFREVQPNVFANNKYSSLFLKRKSLSEIEADPLAKYDLAPISAFAGIFTDEAFMSSQYLPQFLKDPGPYQSAFNIAIKDTINTFAWYDKPDNAVRGRRFAAGWKGIGDRFPPVLFTSALDWKALSDGSTVVDVGANVGSATLTLAKEFPHLHYVVQDLEFVIAKEAKDFWNEKLPEALTDGRVELQVHDFFKPMPISADVYLLRRVVHDWPKAEAEKILKNIRASAKPSSKLLICEEIMPHACAETSPFAADLAGLGKASPSITAGDIHMMTMLGGRERTIEEFVKLGDATGWKLESVKTGPLARLIYAPA